MALEYSFPFLSVCVCLCLSVLTLCPCPSLFLFFLLSSSIPLYVYLQRHCHLSRTLIYSKNFHIHLAISPLPILFSHAPSFISSPFLPTHLLFFPLDYLLIIPSSSPSFHSSFYPAIFQLLTTPTPLTHSLPPAY